MDADLDLTNKKQRAQAEAGAAERISAEIFPHLFHDAEKRAWITLPVEDGHLETWAVNSSEMSSYLEGAFWKEMKSWKRHPHATKVVEGTTGDSQVYGALR